MHIIKNTVRKVIKRQVTELSLLLMFLDSPEKVLWLLRSLFSQGLPSPWQWMGWQVWEAQACVNTYSYILNFFFFFAVILGLQRSKDSTGFPYNLHLTLSSRNILCNRDIFIPNKKCNSHTLLSTLQVFFAFPLFSFFCSWIQSRLQCCI